MSETIICDPSAGTWVSNFNTAAASKPYFAGSKRLQYVGGAYYSFVRTDLPNDLDQKEIVSAKLWTRMLPGTGTRDTKVQRHAKPATEYSSMTWNNKPGVLDGSVTHTTSQVATTDWRSHDVTADLLAIQQGDPYYGWRITSTFASQWGMYGWETDDQVYLEVVLNDIAVEPTGLLPSGQTAAQKPVFTWLAPAGVTSVQLQIGTATGDFTTPLWDSGVVLATAPQVDTDALGYAGITTGDTVTARVRHTTDAGTSSWSLPVTLQRVAFNALTATGPGTTTSDPTPTVTWTFTGQTAWWVTTYVNGSVRHDTGWVRGTDTAFTPPLGAGASKINDVINFRIRAVDAIDRTPSPGDPGFVETARITTYVAGTGAAVTTLTAVQDGVRPAVDLAWTRTAGVPDEWFIARDGVIITRLNGTSGGQPVLTYKDWTCPPNRKVTYTVIPVTAGLGGAVGPAADITTVVTGVWIIDPATGIHFSCAGESLQLAYPETTQRYEVIGSSTPTKRLWGQRGLEGTVGGSLDAYDGRTVFQQEYDLFRIKERPLETFRYVGGDVNIPVLVSDLTSVIDGDQSLTDSIVKQVSFTVQQNGELPFDPVAL